MSAEGRETLNPEALRQRVLSRWDNEGGASASAPTKTTPLAGHAEAPPLTNIELVQLRIRVIALENLVIALLAAASDRPLEVAREMATHLSDVKDRVHHPLTVQAAVQMTDLIERAGPYRPTPSSRSS